MTVERSAANGDRFARRNRVYPPVSWGEGGEGGGEGRGESPGFPVTRRENAVPLLRRRSSPAGARAHFSTNAQTNAYVRTYNGPWPLSLDHLEFSTCFACFTLFLFFSSFFSPPPPAKADRFSTKFNYEFRARVVKSHVLIIDVRQPEKCCRL